MRIRLRWAACSIASTLVLAGCATPSSYLASQTSPENSTPSPSTGVDPAPDATSSASNCLHYAQQLPLDQQVGQLYMVALQQGSHAADILPQIASAKAGSVILLGNWANGIDEVRTETKALQDSAPGGIPLFIATDQEGGQVQKLKGPGFAEIPSAAKQAQLSDADLQSDWRTWGSQLSQAGINMNLAPVADVVPAEMTGTNQAIGQLERGYGSDAAQVGQKVSQVISGLGLAGVASSVKHFPGLGKVSENTDFAVGHDQTSTLSEQELLSFQKAIDAGASSVMISSAVYDQVDPDNPAMFSPAIVTRLLREKMGFSGLVVSDDLGAAASLSAYPTEERGTLFFQAGGDLAVVADAPGAQEMAASTLANTQSDPQFAQSIAQKASRVLEVKKSLGLVTCES